jgi:hypothetical protein
MVLQIGRQIEQGDINLRRVNTSRLQAQLLRSVGWIEWQAVGARAESIAMEPISKNKWSSFPRRREPDAA